MERESPKHTPHTQASGPTSTDVTWFRAQVGRARPGIGRILAMPAGVSPIQSARTIQDAAEVDTFARTMRIGEASTPLANSKRASGTRVCFVALVNKRRTCNATAQANILVRLYKAISYAVLEWTMYDYAASS